MPEKAPCDRLVAKALCPEPRRVRLICRRALCGRRDGVALGDQAWGQEPS